MTMTRAFSLGWSLLLLATTSTTNVNVDAAAPQTPRFRKRIVHRSLRPDTTTAATTSATSSATAIASNDEPAYIAIGDGFDWAATSMSMSMSMDIVNEIIADADGTPTPASTKYKSGPADADVPLPIEQLTFDDIDIVLSMPMAEITTITATSVPVTPSPEPELITITTTITSSPSHSPATATPLPWSSTTGWPTYSPSYSPTIVTASQAVSAPPLNQNEMSLPGSKAAKTKPPTSTNAPTSTSPIETSSTGTGSGTPTSSPSKKPSTSPSTSPTATATATSDPVDTTSSLPADNIVNVNPVTSSSSTTTAATTTSSTISATATAAAIVNPTDDTKTSSTTTTSTSSAETSTTSTSTSSSVETISLETNVQLDLATMVGVMDDNATAVLEQSCDEFLNDMLSMAETPISNVKCQAMSQEYLGLGEGRRRLGFATTNNYRREGGGGGDRRLSGSLSVDVNVKGTATATSSVRDSSDIPFDALVVGTFNANSPVFISQLQADGVAAEIDDFDSLTSVYAIQQEPTDTASNNGNTIDGAKNPDGTGTGTGNNNNNESGIMDKGIIAAIVACGTVVVAMFGYGLYAANQRRQSARSLNNDDLDNNSLVESEFEQDTYMDQLSGMVKNATGNGAHPSLSMDESAAADNQLILRNNTTTTEAQNQHGETLTYMYSLEDGLQSPQSLLSHNIATPTSLTDELQRHMTNFTDGAKSLAPAPLPNRIRKDIYAPPGKLGIIIDTCSEGPIVHSVKPTSPLITVIFKGDLVVAVDDEGTVEWSAHYLTKLVAKKSKCERKITVMRVVVPGNDDDDEEAKKQGETVDDILNSDV